MLILSSTTQNKTGMLKDWHTYKISLKSQREMQPVTKPEKTLKLTVTRFLSMNIEEDIIKRDCYVLWGAARPG